MAGCARRNPGILKPDLNNTGPFRWCCTNVHRYLPIDRMAAELIEMDAAWYKVLPRLRASHSQRRAHGRQGRHHRQAFLGQNSAALAATMAHFILSSRRTCSLLAAMMNGKALKLPATGTVPLVLAERIPL